MKLRIPVCSFVVALSLLFSLQTKADLIIQAEGTQQVPEIVEIESINDVSFTLTSSDDVKLDKDFAVILSSDEGTFGPDCEKSILITNKNIHKYNPITFHFTGTEGVAMVHLYAAQEMEVTYQNETITVSPMTEIYQMAVFDMSFDGAKTIDPERTYEAIAFGINYDGMNYVPPVKKTVAPQTSSLKMASTTSFKSNTDATTLPTKERFDPKKHRRYNGDWARMSSYNPQDNSFTKGSRINIQSTSFNASANNNTELVATKKTSVATMAASKAVSPDIDTSNTNTIMALATDMSVSSPEAIDPNDCIVINDRYLSESTTWNPNETYLINDPPFIISDAKTLNIPSGTNIYYKVNTEAWVDVFVVENGGILRTDYLVPDNTRSDEPVTILPFEDGQNRVAIYLKQSASPDCQIRNTVVKDCIYGIYNRTELTRYISDNYIYNCNYGITSVGNNTIFNNLCYQCGGASNDNDGWAIAMFPYSNDYNFALSDLDIDSIEYGMFNNTVYDTAGFAFCISGISSDDQTAGIPAPQVHLEKNITSHTEDISYYFEGSGTSSGIYWAGFSNDESNATNSTLGFYCAVTDNTELITGEYGDWNLYLDPQSDFIHQVKLNDYLNVIHSVKTNFENIYSSSVTFDDTPVRDGAIGKHNFTTFTGTVKALQCDIAPETPDGVVNQLDLDLLNSVFSQTVPVHTEIDYELLDPNAVCNFNDSDYIIDLLDFSLLAARWETSTNGITDPNELRYDMDNDQWVGISDLSQFASYFCYEIPTISYIEDGADPNVIKADVNGDYVVDDLDRNLLLAEMESVQIVPDVPTIVTSFRGISEEPNYPDELFSWNNIKGDVEVAIEPIEDIDKVEVFIHRNRIGLIFFDGVDDFNKFQIYSQDYKPGTYDVVFNLHHPDGAISVVRQPITFTNNNLHSVNIPTLLDEDIYRIQFSNGTENTRLTVTNTKTDQVLHNAVYTGNEVEVVFDPNVPGFDNVEFSLEALPAVTTSSTIVPLSVSQGEYKDPDTTKNTKKKKKKRKKKKGEADDDEFKLLISIPDESMERFVDDIIEFIIDACYSDEDHEEENCVVPYVIYDGVEFNWNDFSKRIEKNSHFKYWINFSHGNYDEERGLTYTVIWKNIPGTDKCYPTRLYSFSYQTNSIIETLEAQKYCYMSDLNIRNEDKLKFVYNFACKSGKTLFQYGNYYNDFADACGMYSTYYNHYQAYIGFHDNFVAYDGIGDYIELLTRAEEFHKKFFKNLKLRVHLESVIGLTMGSCGKAVIELIQGYDAEWDVPYSKTKDPIYQDSLRIYPWTDLNRIHFQ